MEGPTSERRTGRTNRPWKSPKTTTQENILKKVRNTYELLKATRLKAKKVENPPLKTAVPIRLRVSWVLSFLLPFLVMM